MGTASRRALLLKAALTTLGPSLARAFFKDLAPTRALGEEDLKPGYHRREDILSTRGIVILDTDLSSYPHWPQLACEAGLNTLGIGPGSMSRYLRTFLHRDEGQAFLAACAARALQVEHELHMIADLLPRRLFEKDQSLFRMNDEGARVPQNCCVHSAPALEIIAENAIRYAQEPISTTGRYFFWIDDAQSMCRCPRCRAYSDSDQALILENFVIKALRRHRADAQLAHLAYMNTLEAPRAVPPEPGVFLEFAPIERSYEEPLRHRNAGQQGRAITHGHVLEHLDANLEVFGSAHAQVLEYWLDVSRFSGWERPAVALPWRPDVLEDDLVTYFSRGIRNITSYGAWIDAQYLGQYGDLPVREYGRLLRLVS